MRAERCSRWQSSAHRANNAKRYPPYARSVVGAGPARDFARRARSYMGLGVRLPFAGMTKIARCIRMTLSLPNAPNGLLSLQGEGWGEGTAFIQTPTAPGRHHSRASSLLRRAPRCCLQASCSYRTDMNTPPTPGGLPPVFRSYVEQALGLSVPKRASDIVSCTVNMDALESNDSFWIWLKQVRGE